MALAALLAVVLSPASAAVPAPPELERWQAYVLGDDQSLCVPVERLGQQDFAQCVWAGQLSLIAEQGRVTFAFEVEVSRPTRVPLPGNSQLPASGVTVDGQSAGARIGPEGFPTVFVSKPGRAHIAGILQHAARPQQVPVPAMFGLVALVVDGQIVPAFERSAAGVLLSGAGEPEPDKLHIEVSRLLRDGTPPMLETAISLSVGGSPRQASFNSVLPPGFSLVSLESPLPARLDRDGSLLLQLRPGDYEVRFQARADSAQPVLQHAGAAAPWPDREHLLFRPDPAFRIARVTDLVPVDSEQVFNPFGLSVPAYALDRQSRGGLAEDTRGAGPAGTSLRLALERRMFLDFDGAGITAVDDIAGDFDGRTRLDTVPPWRMEAARVEETAMVITSLQPAAADTDDRDDPRPTGIEVREPAGLSTQLRAPASGSLPTSGYDVAFEQASVSLQLPPGYGLIAATGVDFARGSWLSRWTLLDLFAVALGAVLAWRIAGPLLLTAWLVYALFGWHAGMPPRMSLIVVLALISVRGLLQDGRMRRVVVLITAVFAAFAVLLALPFAYGQIQLALYPQLDSTASVDSQTRAIPAPAHEPLPASAPAVPPPPNVSKSRSESMNEPTVLDSVGLTGSRTRALDLFEPEAGAVAQAGRGIPDWTWRTVELGWTGPVVPDDTMRLYVSPPFATAIGRLLSVLALAFLIATIARRLLSASFRPAAGAFWRGFRKRGSDPDNSTEGNGPGQRASAWLAIGLLAVAASALPPDAAAQAFPSKALLDDYRAKLLAEFRQCRPSCAAIGGVQVTATSAAVELRAELVASAATGVPMPKIVGGQWQSARIDGEPALVIELDGQPLIKVERGIHDLALVAVVGDKPLVIQFPAVPPTLVVDAPDFSIEGTDGIRLRGDILTLTPAGLADPAEAAGDAAASAGGALIEPFVIVKRNLIIDRELRVYTQVARVAPVSGSFSIDVPLLPGEQPLAELPQPTPGVVRLDFANGQDEVVVNSRLPSSAQIVLTAGDWDRFAEQWQLSVSPYLHADALGVPRSTGEKGERYLPLPGETLTVDIVRPAALPGDAVTFDSVSLRVEPGKRARNETLELRLRSTQPGTHDISVPAGTVLSSAHRDGQSIPLRLEGGKASLPVTVGDQLFTLELREPAPIGWILRAPAIDLNAPARNISIDVIVPQDRWVLAVFGPRLGPAVLYWPHVILMALLAAGLARTRLTPLSFAQWLLLGLGFSTLSWPAAVLIAVTLLVFGWRCRGPLVKRPDLQRLAQAGLIALAALALLVLVSVLPAGLLGGQPDMLIKGPGSTGRALHWFSDAADGGALPTPGFVSVPLLVYKGLLLAWSLWLAFALIRWARWAWDCWHIGGGWPSKPVKVGVEPPVTTQAAAVGDGEAFEGDGAKP